MQTQTATTKRQVKKAIEKTEAQATYASDASPSENHWEAMKAQGMPVSVATFHRTVTAGNGTPETAFYASGTHIESRIAKMWYAPCGLLCEQAKGKKLIVPLANVVYAKII